ncbi:unnamed protein product, partial [Rangifer tarandus platyrhynchus]
GREWLLEPGEGRSPRRRPGRPRPPGGGGEGGSQSEQPGRRESRAEVETPILLSSDVNWLSP